MRKPQQSRPEIADTARHPDAALTDRWSWVERSVWTTRMLTALEQGVKGGKWHSLIDKVYKAQNLHAAYQRVAANNGSPGVDGVSVARYADHLQHNQTTLAESLRAGSYRPKPARRTYIEKRGSRTKRPLGIPCVRDRVAETALKHVLEPIFEATFADTSYGFRPGRSCHDALRVVETCLHSGYTHIVDADIKGYFDNIDQSLLMTELRKQIGDGRILDLLELYLQRGIFDGLAYWQPEDGVPQGAVISPLLANVFLNPFDWYMQSQGIQLVRYADDFVLLCRSAAEAERALELTRQWMEDHQLTLHPDKTCLVDMTQHRASFTFLGYEFLHNVNRRGQSRLLKLTGRKADAQIRENIRNRTPRLHGASLDQIIADLNRYLRGWYGYFKHCFKSVFPIYDGMLRRRLRRILRKRHKKHKGSGTCLTDHERWPNSFFAEHGLFSLVDAHASDCQSFRRTH